MSSVVKCNSCNIIISEPLAFIQNKMQVMDEESLVRICVTAFTSAEIEVAKTLLFDAVALSSQKKTRKREGKSQRDVDDIIQLFKSVDPDKTPIFVARDLHKLPPVTFDHLDATKLLRDILLLQNEWRHIKDSYVTKEQVSQIISQIDDTSRNNKLPLCVDRNSNSYVTKKRGAGLLNSFEYDSGPMGLVENNVNCDLSLQNDENSSPTNIAKIPASEKSEQSCLSTLRWRSIQKPVSPGIVTAKRSAVCAGNESPSQSIISASVNSSAACVMQTKQLDENHDVRTEKWTTVVNKKSVKRQNNPVGRMGRGSDSIELNFKAAAGSKIPLFITNIHKDTSDQHITDYICRKSQENVKVIKLKIRNDKHNAYKLFVPKHKLRMFLDDRFWPEGVIYRRFVHVTRNVDTPVRVEACNHN